MMTNVQKAYDRVYRSDERIGNVLMKTLNVKFSNEGRSPEFLFMLVDIQQKNRALEDGYILSFTPSVIFANGEKFST